MAVVRHTKGRCSRGFCCMAVTTAVGELR
ncbi:hypothetical protein M6B38_134310 [Iris pallida]|uniref:Uncharacterized protein n=1 Tax=Iris pallida TaxID=29817 RepID=A0AAX6FGQ7_IRIPA|nr:hypothetical protein M6B38_134310 [Iris pallida]